MSATIHPTGLERYQSDLLALLRLALPMIGMTISRMLMGFIDFAMVSQLGTAAQAAISPSALLLFVIACVGMGMAQGVQTFVSQADGRGEPQRAGAYVWQTLYIALMLGALGAPVATFVGYWFPLLGQLGHHPPDVQAMEIRFLSYGLWSIGPMIACAGLESFYNGIRRPMIGLTAVIVSLVTIAVGNYVLIFGHWGFPAMGIAGSGLATLLAWVARMLVLAFPLWWPSIDARYRTRRTFALRGRELLDIVRIGGPISAQWLVDIGAWLVFMELMMPPYGKAAMAGANVSIQFMHLSFMPALGIGMALTTQVGNAIGAGSPAEAVRRVRIARGLIMAYMGLMSLLFLSGGEWLASLLTFEQDPALRAQVIEMARIMLIWCALFQLSDAMCIVYSFALRGAGDTRVPAMLFAACCWVIFVGGGYMMTRLLPGWGVSGPWSMCTLYIVVLGVLLAWRFHSHAWRRIHLFASAAEPPPDTGDVGPRPPVSEPVAPPTNVEPVAPPTGLEPASGLRSAE